MGRHDGRSSAVREIAKWTRSGGVFVTRRSFPQPGRDVHEVVGEHRGTDQQFETLGALGETPLHAATAEQDGDPTLDTGSKALTFLELRALLVGRALWCLVAATLGNARHLDAILRARYQVLFTVEAPIRAIQFRSAAEDLPVMVQ